MGQSDIFDVVILGSGPAGLNAAIYTSRAFLKTAVLTGFQPLGQLTTTTLVENFPGFPDGIMGPELMQKMEAQAKKFGAEKYSDEATILNEVKDPLTKKKLFTINDKYQSRSVIIATGASHKSLGLPEEKDFLGHGLSYCATCDAFFFRDKNVAVVGGGDTAMEEANFISRFAKKVYLIHRRAEFRASKIMQEKIKKNPKIEIVLNRVAKSLVGDDLPVVPKSRANGTMDKPGGLSLRGIILQSTTNERDLKLSVDGLFVAIGLKPNTDFLKGKITLDEKGYIKKILSNTNQYYQILTNTNKLKNKKINSEKYGHMTNIEGIFFAGDVADSEYRQAVTAAGDGCAAALEVEKWLDENK